MVNSAGLITPPGGSTAPALVQPDGTAFIVDEDGNLIPSGRSVTPTEEDNAGGTEEDNASGIQYDNA